jgi:AsmA family protein
MPPHQRSRLGRVAWIAGFILAGLVILPLLAAGGFAWWLSRTDLRPIVEREASEALGRQVTLGSFRVRWGDPLSIEFTDLSIANAPWASNPEMAHIGSLSALLEVGPLLHGVLRYQRLRMADVTVVLERDPGGVGNWKFGGSADSSGRGLMPKDRTQFPTLIDFVGDRGLITYRTRSGNILRVKLDHVAISSPGDDTPARLMAEGAYNDVATRLEGATESYATLRDDDIPFGARFTLAGKDTDIAFDGTLMEPLDFEGAQGELSIEARTLNDILGVMGAKAKADLPLSIAGLLDRNGDRWSLKAAKGQMMQSPFFGNLALLEGGPGEPDDISLDLDFGALDVDAIVAAFGGGKGPTKLDAIPLHPAALAEVDLSTALTTARLTMGGHILSAVTLEGRIAGGNVSLKEFSFAIAGGTLSTAGTLKGDGDNGQLALKARLVKADVSEIARELGASGEEIRGRLDGAAVISMTGATIGTALKRSDGGAVLVLRDGDVPRSLLEQLSADLRSLFRSTEGRVPVTCLLAVLTLKQGIGIVSPLRLESREAIATGAGRIDLVKDTLDLTVKTERDSTNFFALDIPIRISGPLGQLSVTPLAASDEDWLEHPAATNTLPSTLRKMVDGNPCRN